MAMRAVKSCDLNGFGAAWKESVSDTEGGAGVADEEATPDVRGLKAVLVDREERRGMSAASK